MEGGQKGFAGLECQVGLEDKVLQGADGMLPEAAVHALHPKQEGGQAGSKGKPLLDPSGSSAIYRIVAISSGLGQGNVWWGKKWLDPGG